MADCLDDAQLKQMVSGNLSDAEFQNAEAHVNACPDCRRRRKELSLSVDSLLDDLRGIDADSVLKGPRANVLPADSLDAALASKPNAVPPPAQTPTDEIPPDLNIEGYELIREIHRGGQGIVYRAVQHATRRDVAIKLLLQGTFATPAAVKRFDREVHLSARLKHRNIITIFDSGVASNGCRYYVMDYIDGPPLNAYVRRHELSFEEVLRLFVYVCRGVQYAHENGVVHRDLKPSNILVEKSTDKSGDLGTPRILDFGLAKFVAGPADTLLSLSGQVFGTLPYMAPEQVSGKSGDIDTRADVYALGVILYELLTGTYPYPVDDRIGQVIRHIGETEPTPPSRAWTAAKGIKLGRGSRRWRRSDSCPIDGEVQTIVLQCLAKNRRQRYPSAGELADDIERYLAGEAIQAKRQSRFYVIRKSLPRHKLAFAVVALVVITALSAVVVSGLRTRLREQHARLRADLLDQMQQSLMLMDVDGVEQLTERWGAEGFGDAEYEAFRGWAYMLRLDDDAALASADRAIALNPEYAIAYYLRACIYSYRADAIAAAADFGRAQQYSGDSILELGLAGMLKGLLQQYEASIADLDRLVEQQSGSAAALWIRGGSRWFHVLRDPPADLDERWRIARLSQDDINAAIKLYPNVPFVYDTRADLLRRLAHMAKVRGDLRLADEFDAQRRADAQRMIDLGTVGNGHRVLAAVAFDNGDLTEALRQADTGYEHLTADTTPASINKNDALRAVVIMRIWTRWTLGEDDAAIALAEQLARRHPEFSRFFAFGFVRTHAADPASPGGSERRAALLAEDERFESDEQGYVFGLWAGAKLRGDDELAARVANRLDVGLIDRFRWPGVWTRFMQGDEAEAALLASADEDQFRVQCARLSLALAAKSDDARLRQLQAVFDTAHPSFPMIWARGLDWRHRPPQRTVTNGNN